MLFVKDLIEDVTLFWKYSEEKGVVTRRHSRLIILLGKVLGPIHTQCSEPDNQNGRNDLNINIQRGIPELFL